MNKKSPTAKNKKRPFVIGVTGSIGMGKSTVSDMFAEHDIPVNNADKDVHKAMGPGGAAVDVLAEKLPDTLRTDEDGQSYIDRGALAAHVFKDMSVLDLLEETLHPIVGQIREDFVEDMANDGYEIILCDIPLLFENDLDKEMDLTICVSAPEDVQKQRVLARPGMTEEKLESFLKRQMTDKDKRARADIVLDTSVSLDETKEQVEKIIKEIKDGTIKPKQSQTSGVRNGRDRGRAYGGDN